MNARQCLVNALWDNCMPDQKNEMIDAYAAALLRIAEGTT